MLKNSKRNEFQTTLDQFGFEITDQKQAVKISEEFKNRFEMIISYFIKKMGKTISYPFF